MKFQVLKSNSGAQPYHWRIVAANGQVLATSETYVAKQSCLEAIAAVKKGASSAPIVDDTQAASVRR